jgi:peptidoglycan/xylan/chitin deacetylase (PgdA/CDA1 family)
MSSPIVFLNYHDIGATTATYAYNLPVEEFDSHLRALSSTASGHPAAMGITFDDGLRSQFEHAFPALSREGVKATFFVTAGLTDDSPRHMTWGQLRQLSEAGHAIQAHGWVHRFFTFCTDAELEEELRRPKEEIEDRVGRPVDTLSFPGGRFDARVLSACRRIGYRRAFTSRRWPLAWQEGGMEMFARCVVQSHTTAATLMDLMRTGGRPTAKEHLRHVIQRELRRAIGDERYHRLWCRLAHSDPGPDHSTRTRGQ